MRTRRLPAALLLATVVAIGCDQAPTPADPNPEERENPTSVPGVVSGSERASFSVGGAASMLGQPVPSSVIVSANGLDWVWASPCTPPPDGCTTGIDAGHDGFDFATAAQWALRPPVTAFSIPAQCASPWFDHLWNHCDLNDALNGYYGSSPNWQSGPNGGLRNPNAETWLVRGVALSPADQIAACMDQLESLIHSDALSRRVGLPLLRKLAQARRHAIDGVDAEAVAALQQFMDLVDAFMRDGALDPALGQSLLVKAAAIIAALGGVPS